MANKSTQIKLYNEEGKLETHKSGKIMARATRDIMKMYAEMERKRIEELAKERYRMLSLIHISEPTRP